MTTDGAGQAVIPAEILFPANFRRDGKIPPDDRSPLYVRQKDRKLVGITLVSASQLGGQLEVRLQPACIVTGSIESSELDALGLPRPPCRVYLILPDLPYISKMPLNVSTSERDFEFWLPAGEYQLEAFSRQTYARSLDVAVRPGQTELRLGVLDLPAMRLYKLLGQSAPEFRQVKGWKNSEPLTLAKLKGKVVVLDFWGYWCGPCIVRMPEFFDLSEKYSDRNVVLIAVHDDSLDSTEELEEHLDRFSREYWDGREMSLPVLLDGGGDVPIPGAEAKTVRGATCAAYGIVRWPTAVVIDRNGTVVYFTEKRDRQQFEQAIEAALE